jgi:hypothetical protein
MRKNRIITLEINSTVIKIMEINKGKVVKWASYSLEPDMFEEEVISNPQALGNTIKGLMTSSGIQGRNVIASVSSLYSLSRIITVPTPLGESVTQEAVLDAAREVMPLSEEDLYISWRTIATGEGGQQVLVVGVPRDVIDSEVQTLRTIGVNPRTLDLRTMALARAVNREQALILNIDPSSFDVVMVVDGVAEVMRTTKWQQEDLSVEERAEHLASALEVTVSFYNSHYLAYPFDPVTPLFITGQMSEDLALVENIKGMVKYPVEPLAPPLEYPAHLPVSQHAVNIGLALKEKEAPKNVEQGAYSLPDINLLPQVYQPWKPSARQIYLFCAIIAAVIGLFPLYQVASGAMAETALLQTRYDIINTELQRRQLEIKNREPLQKAVDEYDSIVDMGGDFTEDIRVINSQAEKLSIEVQSITHGGSTITVICQAESYHTFRDFLTALEESGRFSTPIPESERFPYREGGTVRLTPKPSD